MPKIQNIQRDFTIDKNDKLLGSDAGGPTRNFPIGDIAGFLANKGLVTVAGQSVYQFKLERSAASLTGPSDNSSFSSITTIKLSEVDGAEHNIENFLQEYKNKRIILVQVDNKNNYGIYDVDNIVEDTDNPNYYDFTLEYHSGNGNLILDKYYILATYAQDDKHKELNFTTNTFEAGTEVINGSTMRYFDFTHNLDKYPAITATEVGSEDQVANVPVKYLNTNTVRVYFTGVTNGKLYAN